MIDMQFTLDIGVTRGVYFTCPATAPVRRAWWEFHTTFFILFFITSMKGEDLWISPTISVWISFLSNTRLPASLNTERKALKASWLPKSGQYANSGRFDRSLKLSH